MLDFSFFSEKLSELILDNQISKDKLLVDIGIDRSTLNKYLTEKRLPTVSIAVKIANYFNCSLDFLLGLTDVNYVQTYKECPPFKIQLPILLEKLETNKYKLQKHTEIPESAIYNWQRGDSTPSLDSIITIAQKYNCSVDFVIGRGD